MKNFKKFVSTLTSAALLAGLAIHFNACTEQSPLQSEASGDKVLLTFWWKSTGFLEGGSDFSPHGTLFNEPVQLELSYKDADLTGVNEDDLEIRYYNEGTGQWEFIGNEVDKNKKVVRGYTDHFSRYAIGAE